MIDSAMNKYIGATINEISLDISDKLKRSPLIDFDFKIMDFKTAKRLYIKQYLIRLLETNHGNISKVAIIADVDRRSIHRLIQKFDIDVAKLREELMKPYYVREAAISSMIEKTLDNYKQVVRPEKLEKAYKNVSVLSKEILKELPIEPMTLKKAEQEFEKMYIKRILEHTKGNISEAARLIGLRFETLHRKIKKLDL